MLNLSKETKAVLLFGSVYRVRPSSLSSGCKWVKWHSEPLVPSCMWPVPGARLLQSDCGGRFQPFHQPPAGCSWGVPALRLGFLAGCWSTAMDSSVQRHSCVPLLCGRQGGNNHISCTTESMSWAPMPSSNTAFPTPVWFNIQRKEQLDWSHVREPCCDLLSEHETGSLKNNGIN